MFKLFALGINGWIPSYGRQTMCFLLLDSGDEIFILDAGTGLSGLLRPEFQRMIGKRRRMNIILSHYHLDHVIGLTYLPAIWREKPLRLYAPAEPFVDTSAQDAVNKLLNPPLFPLSFAQFPAQTEILPVNRRRMEIGGHDFSFFGLPHGGGSMGMKIDERFAYITDTHVDDSYLTFVDGVALLMHEVWLTRRESRTRPEEAVRHSVLEEVTDLAKTCSVKKLLPVHINPRWDESRVGEVMTLARQAFADTVWLGERTGFDLNG